MSDFDNPNQAWEPEQELGRTSLLLSTLKNKCQRVMLLSNPPKVMERGDCDNKDKPKPYIVEELTNAHAGGIANQRPSYHDRGTLDVGTGQTDSKEAGESLELDLSVLLEKLATESDEAWIMQQYSNLYELYPNSRAMRSEILEQAAKNILGNTNIQHRPENINRLLLHGFSDAKQRVIEAFVKLPEETLQRYAKYLGEQYTRDVFGAERIFEEYNILPPQHRDALIASFNEHFSALNARNKPRIQESWQEFLQMINNPNILTQNTSAEDKFGISADLEGDAVGLFRQSGLTPPTRREIEDAVGPLSIRDDAELSAMDILDRVLQQRAVEKQNREMPNVKTAMSKTFRDTYLGGCTEEVVRGIFEQRFGKSHASDDRIPTPLLKILVEQQSSA